MDAPLLKLFSLALAQDQQGRAYELALRLTGINALNGVCGGGGNCFWLSQSGCRPSVCSVWCVLTHVHTLSTPSPGHRRALDHPFDVYSLVLQIPSSIPTSIPTSITHDSHYSSPLLPLHPPFVLPLSSSLYPLCLSPSSPSLAPPLSSPSLAPPGSVKIANYKRMPRLAGVMI